MTEQDDAEERERLRLRKEKRKQKKDRKRARREQKLQQQQQQQQQQQAGMWPAPTDGTADHLVPQEAAVSPTHPQSVPGALAEVASGLGGNEDPEDDGLSSLGSGDGQ